jgi:glycosyltransferase involved in cell wall biosynthesis
MRRPYLSIIVPCYNETSHLRVSSDEIIKSLAEAGYDDYELIFVDDGSEDGTRDIIQEIARGNNRARHTFHERNRGRGAAVKTGMAVASGEIAGFLDADLEVHSRFIHPLVQAVADGADMAVGVRSFKSPFGLDALFRRLLSEGYKRVSRIMLNMEAKDSEAGFKFFNLPRMSAVIQSAMSDGWFWDTEVMMRAHRGGFAIVELPVTYIKRNNKKSTVKPLRDAAEYVKSLFIFRKKIIKGEI